MIKCAVIMAILADVDHPLISNDTARCKKRAFAPACRPSTWIWPSASFHRACARVLDGVEIPRRNFLPQIFLGLFDADEGNAVAKFQNFCSSVRRDGQAIALARAGFLQILTGALNSP